MENIFLKKTKKKEAPGSRLLEEVTWLSKKRHGLLLLSLLVLNSEHEHYMPWTITYYLNGRNNCTVTVTFTTINVYIVFGVITSFCSSDTLTT